MKIGKALKLKVSRLVFTDILEKMYFNYHCSVELNNEDMPRVLNIIESEFNQILKWT